MKKELFNTIKKDKSLLFLIVAILFLIVITIVSFISNLTNKDSEDINTDTFKVLDRGIINENVIPEKTNYSQVDTSNWELIDTTNERNIKVYTYKREKDFYARTSYGVDKNENIKYIMQTIQPYQKITLNDYIERFNLSEPDIISYIKDQDYHLAYVFLEKGIMLYVRESDKKVSHEIYLAQMNKEDFLRLWGSKLTDEPEPHEYAVPNF